jgi:hypothetical protein
VQLPAARGVKHGAVELYGIAAPLLLASDHGGMDGMKIAVIEIEPFGHVVPALLFPLFLMKHGYKEGGE